MTAMMHIVKLALATWPKALVSGHAVVEAFSNVSLPVSVNFQPDEPEAPAEVASDDEPNSSPTK